MFNLSDYAYPTISNSTLDKINSLKSATLSGVDEMPENLSYLSHLNDKQRLAASKIDGAYLLIAGAGSGKTTTLIARTVHLIKSGVHPSNILLLTFTNKAALEMQQRIKTQVGEKVTASTFHSFACNMLRTLDNSNFIILDDSDSIEILDIVMGSMGLKSMEDFPGKKNAMSIISEARNWNLDLKDIAPHPFKNQFSSLFSNYQDYKKKQNVLDFDDLIDNFILALQQEDFRNKINNRFKYLMIDEYQDTNVKQDILANYLSDHGNIMVCGDDCQSIYKFRGANLDNILSFPKKKEAEIIMLDVNYRSSENIVNFGNAINLSLGLSFDKVLQGTYVKENKVQIVRHPSSEEEAEYIAKKVRSLLESGVPPQEIAILNRSSFHNKHLQLALGSQNINFKVVGGVKFFERKYIKDFLAYCKIILNYRDAVSWNRALTNIGGVGQVSAKKIIDFIQENDGKPDFSLYKKRSFYKSIRELKLILDKAAGLTCLQDQLQVIRDYYLQFIDDDESYFYKVSDLDMLIDMSHNSKSLLKFVTDLTLDNEKQNKELAVTVSTIHSAKGLEWDHVFVIHCLDGLFPSIKSLNDFEDLEEERRLFYVACTRARTNLEIHLPKIIYSRAHEYNLPSRFIAEIYQKADFDFDDRGSINFFF